MSNESLLLKSDIPQVCGTQSFQEYQARIFGCIMGGAVGDALGAPVEFMTISEIFSTYGNFGVRDINLDSNNLLNITDDTQLTLFTLEAVTNWIKLLKTSAKPTPLHENLVTSYKHWYLTQVFTFTEYQALNEVPISLLLNNSMMFSQRDPGITCMNELRNLYLGRESGRNDSKGSGGIMRVAPIGMINFSSNNNFDSNLNFVFDQAVDSASITHGHASVGLSAGFLAIMINLLLRGIEINYAINIAKCILQGKYRSSKLLKKINFAQNLASKNIDPLDAIPKLGEGWIAEEALLIALYCSLKAKDFEPGVLMAINHSGDSDTTGAITGNLLGAYFGAHAIPSRWSERIEMREMILFFSEQIANQNELNAIK